MGEDPANTAIKNEVFNAYKLGMIATLTFIDQQVAALKADLEHLEAQYHEDEE